MGTRRTHPESGRQASASPEIMYGGATVPAAAEARVVRANSMYGGAHSMVVSQEERKKVAEAWERLQQDDPKLLVDGRHHAAGATRAGALHSNL